MTRNEDVIKEVRQLIDSGDTDNLVAVCARRVADLLAPAIDSISQIPEVKDVSRDLALRCIGKRTHESMLAIIALTQVGYSYAAPALLRSMCEDLIFASWLLTLSNTNADRFLRGKCLEELISGQRAQARFFPKAREGFRREPRPRDAGVLSRLEEARLSIRKDLEELGEEVGWGKQVSPSVRRMAELTGRLPEYEFFYHSASKSVHSSPHHMMRMIWSKEGSNGYSISSATLWQHHHRFALTYSVWLGAEVVGVLEQVFPRLLSVVDEEAYSVWLALVLVPAVEQEAPPIVTRQELRPPRK